MQVGRMSFKFNVESEFAVRIVASIVATYVACTANAMADGSLPEPGSIGLTGLGLVVAVYFLARGKRK